MKLLYFTDPMCSWCYGFAPVMKKIKEHYPSVDVQIICGGFAPFSKQTVTDEYRNFLAYHWRNVKARSGQPFDHSMKFVSETFCYDTEPASRALTVIQHLLPGADFEFLSLLQTSFYVEGKDITNELVLAELANRMGIDTKDFLLSFGSGEMKIKTINGFEFSRQLGVTGFPTLLSLDNGTATAITRGFQQYDRVQFMIETCLQNQLVAETANGQACTTGTCAC